MESEAGVASTNGAVALAGSSSATPAKSSLKHSSPHFDVFGHELEVGHGSGLGSVPQELVATRDLKKMGFVESGDDVAGGNSPAPVQWSGNPRFRTKADLLRSRREEKVLASRSSVRLKKVRDPPFSFAALASVPQPRPSSRKAKRAPYYTKKGEEALPQRDGSAPSPQTKKELLQTRAQAMHDNLEAGKARYDEVARTLREKNSNLPPRPLRAQSSQDDVSFCR